MQAEMQKSQEDSAKIEQLAEQKIGKILTSRQRTNYNKMLGEEYDLETLLTVGRGGPGGPGARGGDREGQNRQGGAPNAGGRNRGGDAPRNEEAGAEEPANRGRVNTTPRGRANTGRGGDEDDG
jgi:hypothetical protein